MSVSDARLRPSLAASFAAWFRVVRALTILRGQAGTSTKTLGFFWVIAQPAILICGVMAMWMMTGRSEGHVGVSVIPLSISAYAHVQLWRRAVLPSLSIIHHSAFLLYHPRVHILDVIIALVLLESVAIFAAFVVVSGVAMLLGAMAIRDPGLVLAAWALDTYWCFCFSVFIAGLALLNELVDQLMHPLMYLTLPITGAFVMTAWVTPGYREVLEWVALANCCEMLRAGIFSLSVKTYWSVPVIVGESTFFLAIGLPIMEYARRNLRVGA